METHFPKWKGVYTKDEYPILNNSNKVGTIEIRYYGPFYETHNGSIAVESKINEGSKFIIEIPKQ